MNIKQLETFLLVAELRNFTRAAGQLGMSQPAVSFQIKSLEEELGATLLERNDKKVVLTETGRLLYPEVKQLMRHYRKIRAIVSELEGLKSGHLMLGATGMTAEILLPCFIGGFREKHPGVKISLKVGNSQAVARWLQDREVDLGILGEGTPVEAIETQPWLEDELVFITATWHPYNGATLATEELLREPLIARESGSCTRRLLEKKLAEHQIDLNYFPTFLELGSNQAVIQAVHSGLGTGVLSGIAAREALEAGKVGLIHVPGLQNRYFIYLAWPRQGNDTLSAGIFKNFLCDPDIRRRLLPNH
ncbi:MAG: LysR substrate-binding domain-containing protein [Desulfurispora sp.]|uniref:LysR substrate-binding domain-containing protein n=1 Tax=Desulfurispora sp. TaxID=3014275 RepID=UPI004048EE81